LVQKCVIDRIKDPLTFTDGDGTDKEGVGGGIAFADGNIFVASGLGKMVALNAESGELVWARETRVPLNSAPTVIDGRIFVISDDNELFALNSNTGEVLWTYQGIVETASMLTAPAPAVVDDVVVAPFSSGELIALRVQNGGVLWQDSLSSTARLTPLASLNDISGGPAVADGYVIASAQSGVMTAFDLRTGQRVWSQPAGSLSIPLIVGDVVYTATTTGQVAAISKLDGTVHWIQQLENFKNAKKRKERTVWTGPLLAGNRLVVASSRGDVVLLDPRAGTILKESSVARKRRYEDEEELETPNTRPARIAVIGRPNVGKSTLFNRMAGKKLAIVNDTPGVTRDVRETKSRLRGHDMTLMDTAGFENATGDKLEARMRSQTEDAVHGADVLLFVYDAREGVTPLDRIFAEFVRRINAKAARQMQGSMKAIRSVWAIQSKSRLSIILVWSTWMMPLI